ncbi:MAG: hemerythrin domain-containing protein [Candidatus Omnitrophota bacterium]
MSDYIYTWRMEHARILDILTQTIKLGISNRTGQMKLQELKKALESHLTNEDLNLYPVLRKAAETDVNLRRELFLFAADMDQITMEIKAFFRKEERDPMSRDLAAEFHKISGAIRSRIAREESLLIKELEKLAAPQHSTL